jgi:hypothetical protein
MKIVAVTVPVNTEYIVRQQFEQEKGVEIFREKELSTPIPGIGKQVTHIMFLLYLLDPELQTLLALKYPYTFEDVSA